MQKILLLFAAIISVNSLPAQVIYKIKADSTRIYNDDCNAELILENGTRNVSGFLFNKGNGRTEFRSGLIKVNDSTYLIGTDTLNFGKSINSLRGKVGSVNLIGTSYIGITSGRGSTGTSEGTAGNRSNVYIGNKVGNNNTTGTNNVFIGEETGINNTTGSLNVFLGPLSGNGNTSGYSNVFIGKEAGALNTSGISNILIGVAAGKNNSTLNNNIYIGNNAGLYNKYGGSNVGIGLEASGNAPKIFRSVSIGDSAGYSSGDTGALVSYNVFIGALAGKSTHFGQHNTVTGAFAGYHLFDGNKNNLFGFYSGYNLTDGSQNSFYGDSSGFSVTNVSGLTFFGSGSGKNNSAGSQNAFFGYQSGYLNSIGNNNTFFGYSAGRSNTTGDNNIYVGTNAANNATTGNNNIVIGNGAQLQVPSADNQINIGNFLYKDANGNFGIGLSNPEYKLHVSGTGKFDSTLTTSGAIIAVTVKTSAYTLNPSDEFVSADATSAPFSITLPTAQGKTGQTYTIKKVDASANAVAITTSFSQIIDGATTYSLVSQWKYLTVVSDGSNWLIKTNN